MTKTNTSLTRRFVPVLAGAGFFRFIIGLLVFQAIWIALSGHYPMAFDEDFHVGIIRLYAHHLSPFWNGQPPGANQFGAIARDPSYLYHFFMSFPYRLIRLCTADQTIQVLFLRAIDIGLFTSGVILYRRVLLKVGASRAMAHACLLVFVLIPAVPLLAAQINYDNLLFPLVALTLLLALRFDEHLVHQRRIDLQTLLQLVVLCLLTSLVKYAFLPVLVAISGFVLVRIWQRRRSLSGAWLGLAAAWRRLNRRARVGLLAALLLASGLFMQRYGVNLVRYHAPVPDCGQVLTVKQCSEYGPWIRDYNYKLNKLDVDAEKSPLTFTADWFYGMWLRLFFAVSGPDTQFQTRGPLLIPGIGAIIFAVGGIVVTLAALPKLWGRYNTSRLWLCLAVTVSYVAALWLDNYRAYLQVGQPVAINGRYLLPILLPVFLVVALALNELTKRRPDLKLIVVAVSVICLAWGGGALTFILRSNNDWYWPNAAVHSANHAVQRTLGPLTPGYDQPTQFLH